MKLDPRIIEGRKPLTCFDCEEAKQFIGQEGYFANSIDEFCDLNDVIDGKLFDIDDSMNIPFNCIDAVSDNYYYSFFLPREWVKNEPEWRPYLIDEWLQEHNFGDMIEFRHKGSKREFTVMFTGYVQGGGVMMRYGLCLVTGQRILTTCLNTMNLLIKQMTENLHGGLLVLR